MNSFFTLVGFEYKKLFKRKSFIVSLLLVTIVIIILGISELTGKSYWHSEGGTPLLEALKLDKEAARSKAGYIDEALINEAIKQNTLMISDDDNYLINEYRIHLKGEAYINHALPYKKAIMMINVLYEPDSSSLSTDGYTVFNIYGTRPIDSMTSLSENDLYQQFHDVISDRIHSKLYLSQAEKDKHMEMLSEVETPFYNDYDETFVGFAHILQVVALTLLVAVGVCISPVFAGEYQLRTDQIMLPSKYGKNKVILAMLFTDVSFALIMSIAIIIIFLLLFAVHGFSGYNMAIQTMDIFSTYPITMFQSVLIAFQYRQKTGYYIRYFRCFLQKPLLFLIYFQFTFLRYSA